MKTTQTGAAIISEAKSWLDQGCKEEPKGSNVVFCGKKEISWTKTPAANKDAWCAAFVSAVIAKALTDLGLPVGFPMTAGAKDMLNKAISQKKIPVDDIPMPGSAFYRLSASEKASGHVGILVNVDDDNIYTIEGNADDKVGYFKYPKSDFKRRIFKFMHAEQIGGGDYAVNNPMEFKQTTQTIASDGEKPNAYTGLKPTQPYVRSEWI